MAKKYLQATAAAVAGLYIFNKVVDTKAKNHARIQNIKGEYYDWTHGKIFYRTKGKKGSPLILVHNLDNRFSSYEWDNIEHHLADEHRLYILDLPGCGRSDKPKFIYTSYLYVTMLKDFIKDVVKEPSDVVASLDSSAFCVLANSLHRDLIKNLILINPPALPKGGIETDILRSTFMKLLFLPVVGSSVYNIINIPIIKSFDIGGLTMADNAYVSAHLQESNGRFLLGSNINKLTEANFKNQLLEADNITIMLSDKSESCKKNMATYKELLAKINLCKLESHSKYPHHEVPTHVAGRIKKILSD